MWDSKLALDILADEFGATVKAVAEALVFLGASSLQELCKHLSTEPGFVVGGDNISSRVRAALLILTSQNAVACSITVRVLNGPEPTRVKRGRGGKRGGKSSGSSGATSAQAGYVTAGGAAESSGEGSSSAMEATEHGSLRYEFRAGGVLRRMRYARFLGAARSAHGLAGVAIGEVLLRHGPWTKDAAIADAEEWAHALAATKAASMSSSSSAGDADNAAAGADDEDAASLPLTHVDVTKAWSAMVADGFIMHHNGLPAPFPHQLKAASLNEGGAGVSSAAPAASSAAGAGAGKKRGRAVVDDDDESATGATAQQLYRFGWETATKRLRDNLMVRFIKQTTRGNDATTSDAATVVTTMLSIARDASSLGRAATGMGEARSGPISVSSILKRLNKDGVAAGKSSSSSASSSSSWTADRIADILGSLAQQPHSVIRTSDVYTPASISDRIYEVDYLAGVNAMQLRTVESMIAEKYDGHGARIMRMLLERGMLDEKIIADCALIDAKTCRILLFKMVMDGFLTQQELPRRPDRHPQHTYYMFHAHWDRLLSLLSANLCRGMLNMRMRLRMEKQRLAAAEKEVDKGAAGTGKTGVPAKGQATASGAGAGAPKAAAAPTINGADASDLDPNLLKSRMRAGIYKLQASLLRCDETLLVLADL